jgi:hypothetical protein
VADPIRFRFDLSLPCARIARREIDAPGAPLFLMDGEPLRGADRLDRIDRRLATGGF